MTKDELKKEITRATMAEEDEKFLHTALTEVLHSYPDLVDLFFEAQEYIRTKEDKSRPGIVYGAVRHKKEETGIDGRTVFKEGELEILDHYTFSGWFVSKIAFTVSSFLDREYISIEDDVSNRILETIEKDESDRTLCDNIVLAVLKSFGIGKQSIFLLKRMIQLKNEEKKTLEDAHLEIQNSALYEEWSACQLAYLVSSDNLINELTGILTDDQKAQVKECLDGYEQVSIEYAKLHDGLTHLYLQKDKEIIDDVFKRMEFWRNRLKEKISYSKK